MAGTTHSFEAGGKVSAIEAISPYQSRTYLAILGARQDATVGVTVAHVGGKLPVVAFQRMEAPNEWPALERAIAERIARDSRSCLS